MGDRLSDEGAAAPARPPVAPGAAAPSLGRSAMVMAVGMVGVIAVAEVITMVGAEAEATITDGDTIIAVGGDCRMCRLSRAPI